MAGILVDGIHDWPSEQQAIGVEDDFHYLVFPQTDGRARLYGAWDVADKHRYSGDGREQRFLESFRLPCFPEPDAIADATPAGPLAGYPMTDTWTDEVAADGVVLIGDSAGWSDPIIGQGMSVTFRDANLISDVITATDDWSMPAFAAYGDERRERMRRLRYAERGELPDQRVRRRGESQTDPSAREVRGRPDEFAGRQLAGRCVGAPRSGVLRRRLERTRRRLNTRRDRRPQVMTRASPLVMVPDASI